MERQSFMIGVDRLFLAEITDDTTSATTYGASFEVPGVTAIGVSMNNANVTIYADDGAFETVNQQGDIDIVCSLAGLSGEKHADVTGGTYNASTGCGGERWYRYTQKICVGLQTPKSQRFLPLQMVYERFLC